VSNELDPYRVELGRLEEDLQYTEKSHFISERWLRRWHGVLGIVATVASAIAAASVFGENKWVTGIAALIATVAAGIQTFAKPGEHADRHLAAGKELNVLRVQARQAKELRLNQPDASVQQAQAEVEAVTTRKAEIDRVSPGLSEASFRAAKRKIDKGHFAYRADVQRPS
jgi:hypothetical protein